MNSIIHRVKKDKNFTILDNTVLRDKELSWKAKGLHSFLMHCKDSFKITVNGLIAMGNDGRSSVMSALKELEEASYLFREQKRNDKGYFSETTYYLYENKQESNNTNKTPKLDYPYTENPTTDKPTAENPLQISTNSNKSTKTNKNLDILSTSKEVNAEPLLKNTDLNYKEYLEIFDFFVSTTNKNIRLHKTKSLVQRSDRYKKFISTKKKGYNLEDMKAVIKVKNEEWKDDIKMKKHINISTLFGAKFEKYLEQAENPPLLPLNTASNTNTPIQQVKLIGMDLDRFKHLYEQLKDTRFTESTFLNVFGGKKYDAVRNRKTPREIVRAIQAGLNSLSQAFNKNRSLTELIIEKL